MKLFLLSLYTGLCLFSFAQENILDSANFNIIPITGINSKGDDITPLLNNGDFYFLSEQSSDFSEHLNIYSLKKAKIGEDGNPYDPTSVEQIFGSHPSGGPIAISKDGNKAVFTKEVHVKNAKSKEKYKFFLFYAEKDTAGTWSTPIQLPFDDEHYSCSHPTINDDCTKIYFVSDNKDGKGSADIWFSEFKNGIWQEPVDLGDKINTEGKEVFPYLYDENTLFFASDSHDDAENLDIYMAKVKRDKIFSIHHLPAPINSYNNDFSISFTEDKQNAYFSSDRQGENGDDIYKIVFKKELSTTKKNTLSKKHLMSQSEFDKLKTDYYNNKKNNKCVTLDINKDLDTKNKNLSYRWKLSDGTIKNGTAITHCFQKRKDYIAELYTVDGITSYELFERNIPLNLNNNITDISLKDTFWVGEKFVFNYSNSNVIDAVWTIDGAHYRGLSPDVTLKNNGIITIKALITAKGSPLNFTEYEKDILVNKSILEGIDLPNIFDPQKEMSLSSFLNTDFSLKITNELDKTSNTYTPATNINLNAASLKANTTYNLTLWKGNQYSTKISVVTEGESPQQAINKGLAELTNENIKTISPIYFKLNKSNEIEGSHALHNLIKQLKAIPNASLVIKSHLHQGGNINANIVLSNLRSEYIKNKLMSAIPSLTITIETPKENVGTQNQTLEFNDSLNKKTEIKIISL